MAAARKRILRKDIRQPDQFMVWTGWFLDFFKAYRRELTAAGLAVVVVAAVAAGWYYYRGYQRQLAFQQYNLGLREYQEGRYDTALDTFQSLKDRGEAPYDTLADLYIANSHIALDQPEKAIETAWRSTFRGAGGLVEPGGVGHPGPGAGDDGFLRRRRRITGPCTRSQGAVAAGSHAGQGALQHAPGKDHCRGRGLQGICGGVSPKPRPSRSPFGWKATPGSPKTGHSPRQATQ